MISVSKRMTYRFIVSLCAVLLVMLLSACSIPGFGGSSTTPTATNAPAETPTASAAFQTYTDANFTINYPQDWKAQTSNGAVVFADSLEVYSLTVTVTPNPGGALTSDQLADGGVNLLKGSLQDVQSVSVPATATVAGQTWSQRAITGTATKDGQPIVAQIIVLAVSYPANSPTSKGYVIAYGTAQPIFEQANAAYFTPMLQSFKFPA